MDPSFPDNAQNAVYYAIIFVSNKHVRLGHCKVVKYWSDLCLPMLLIFLPAPSQISGYDRVSDVVECCVRFANKILTHHRMH